MVKESAHYPPADSERCWRVPLGLCLLAGLIVLVITWGVFEAMPHIEDEFAYYFQAQVFAEGRLWVASPPRPGSFLVPFAIDLNGRRFSKYPPGFPAVLALGLKAGAYWLVNPLIAALTLWVLYALGRELFDVQTGCVAAGLGLLSPMFLGLSSTLLSHGLCALCLLTFTWAYARLAQRPSHAWGMAALGGLALGWSALTRPYTAAAYALPFGLLAVWQIVRVRRWVVVGHYALMGALCAGLALLLLGYGYALTGQYRIDMYSLVWPYDRLGFGPGHGLFPGGHTPRVALLNAYVDLRSMLTELLGWPSLSWLPLAFGLALPPRRRVETALLLPFVAIVVAQGAYWIHGVPLFGPRYYYEGMPLLWLLAARGLLKLWQALPWPPTRPRLRAAIAAALVIANAVWIFAGVMPLRFAGWYGLYGITRDRYQQVLNSGVHNALIFVDYQHWGDYSELAWHNNLSLDGDLVFALDESSAVNALVKARYPDRRVFYLVGDELTDANRK